jgi:hypothetical protein
VNMQRVLAFMLVRYTVYDAMVCFGCDFCSLCYEVVKDVCGKRNQRCAVFPRF